MATSGKHARPAFRMVVSMFEMGSLIIYQLAFVTPGINPFRAASRKVRREQPNLRR